MSDEDRIAERESHRQRLAWLRAERVASNVAFLVLLIPALPFIAAAFLAHALKWVLESVAVGLGYPAMLINDRWVVKVARAHRREILAIERHEGAAGTRKRGAS